MKTYKEFISEDKVKIAKAIFNSKVVKDLFKKSLTKANKLPREVPNAMKTVSTGPFPKRVMDLRKGYLRNVRQGYITPTPEPIKGITGATSIGKKPGTGVAIHPSSARLDKHYKSRGVKTKGVKDVPYRSDITNPKGQSEYMQYMDAKKSGKNIEGKKNNLLVRILRAKKIAAQKLKDKKNRLDKLFKKGDGK